MLGMGSLSLAVVMTFPTLSFSPLLLLLEPVRHSDLAIVVSLAMKRCPCRLASCLLKQLAMAPSRTMLSISMIELVTLLSSLATST